jgi:hypothetical protein
MNHAKTSFTTEILAGVIISVHNIWRRYGRGCVGRELGRGRKPQQMCIWTILE